MKKKKEIAFDLLSRSSEWLRCPICKSKFTNPQNYSIRCQSNHQFDLSKKGTLYFLSHEIATEYDQEMLLHRRNVLRTKMYQPMIQTIREFLPEQNMKMIDAGCGDGTFLTQVLDDTVSSDYQAIGLDISKDAIYLASGYVEKSLFIVGDITNLPVRSESVDILLNILSPSHYKEFSRVLSPNGIVIKVVPNSDYLIELRKLLYQDSEEKSSYSNFQIVDKFSDEMDLVTSKVVNYRYPLDKGMYNDLLVMSPLYWGASQESKELAQLKQLSEITVDLTVLVGKSKF